MKVTKKSINNVLPRIDWLNKHYIYSGFSGIAPNNSTTISLVVLDIEPDTRTATDCTVYGVGEAKRPAHYHMTGDVFDITAPVVSWMRGDITRCECVAEIQTIVG